MATKNALFLKQYYLQAVYIKLTISHEEEQFWIFFIKFFINSQLFLCQINSFWPPLKVREKTIKHFLTMRFIGKVYNCDKGCVWQWQNMLIIQTQYTIS